MFLQTLCLCALVWAFGEASLEEINLAINSTGAKWVAASTTWEKIYRSALLREHPLGRGSHTNATVTGPLEEMPTEFDIRSEFSKCESVSTIFDQGSCGGCWALSVAAVLSDRFCQQSIDVLLSPQDLLDCVSGSSNGCSGGFTEDGFDYVADEGIRTNSCVPFEAMDGFCATGCADGSKRNADGTKYFTQSWAQYISSDEEKIQQELMSYGSISAVFEVFEVSAQSGATSQCVTVWRSKKSSIHAFHRLFQCLLASLL